MKTVSELFKAGCAEVKALPPGEKALLAGMGIATGLDFAAGAWKLGLVTLGITCVFAYAAFSRNPKDVRLTVK